MELINTFDDLVASVVQIQRKAEELVEKLHFINSDVHGFFGPPDLETIQETLAELQLLTCLTSPLLSLWTRSKCLRQRWSV